MKHYFLKNSIHALFILLISAICLNAQSIQWSQTYGGSSQDGGESMVLTDNGAIVITGFKSANNLKDVLLMKTDESGNELWSRTYNLGLNDFGRSLQKTQDGGFIIGGMTEVNPQTFDPFLIKTDNEGNVQWQQQYDYGFGDDDRGHAVWQTSDGGYILAGQTWLMHGSFGNYDIYIIKTDMNGMVQWKKIFYREEQGGDVALGVQQINDGGYIIGGFTQSSSWASYIIRTDSLGNALWSNIYEGVWQSECYDIQTTPDGGFIFTGTETNFQTDGDLLLTKLDAKGNLLWKKIYGTEDSEQGEFIQQLQDGGYIIAGMSSHGSGGYDMYVVRTNSSGDSLWSKTFGGDGDDRAFSVASPQAGIFYITGWAWSFGQGLGDVYLVKLTEPTSGIINNNSIPGSIELYQNYPNPFNPNTVISYQLAVNSFVSLTVSDLRGKEVSILVNQKQNSGTYSVNFNGSNFSSGIYFYTLKINEFSQTRKMILMK